MATSWTTGRGVGSRTPSSRVRNFHRLNKQEGGPEGPPSLFFGSCQAHHPPNSYPSPNLGIRFRFQTGWKGASATRCEIENLLRKSSSVLCETEILSKKPSAILCEIENLSREPSLILCEIENLSRKASFIRCRFENLLKKSSAGRCEIKNRSKESSSILCRIEN